MNQEIDFIPISALQHWVFCHRRAALIFIERLWQDNLATTEGSILHEHVDKDVSASRGDVRVRTALMLRSLLFGIAGVADVVEFHRTEYNGVELEGTSGTWIPLPIEYKRGSLRCEKAYEVQLCAQALCLEEMLNTTIDSGAIYWGKTRRRQKVEFHKELRATTIQAIQDLRSLLNAGKTPSPKYEKKCNGCSLFNICMPRKLGKIDNATVYWKSFFSDI